MQHTPVVRSPEERRHRDLGLIIALLVILAVAAFAVVMLARPQLLTTEPAVNLYANPEVAQAQRYMAWRAAEAAVAGPINPELFAANRYQQQQQLAQERFLRANPEIRRFLQSQEE